MPKNDLDLSAPINTILHKVLGHIKSSRISSLHDIDILP